MSTLESELVIFTTPDGGVIGPKVDEISARVGTFEIVNVPTLSLTALFTDGVTPITPGAGFTADNVLIRDSPHYLLANRSVASIEGVNAANTEVDIAIVPKGQGSIMVAIPDGTVAGGDSRGLFSIDLQISRAASTQVVSGNNSVITGGSNNTVTGNNSVISGGVSNTILTASINSTITGGTGNSILASDTVTILGGRNNTIQDSSNSICGGDGSTVNQAISGVAIGQGANVFGNTGSVAMGSNVSVNVLATDSWCIGGNASNGLGNSFKGRFPNGFHIVTDSPTVDMGIGLGGLVQGGNGNTNGTYQTFTNYNVSQPITIGSQTVTVFALYVPIGEVAQTYFRASVVKINGTNIYRGGYCHGHSRQYNEGLGAVTSGIFNLSSTNDGLVFVSISTVAAGPGIPYIYYSITSGGLAATDIFYWSFVIESIRQSAFSPIF
jgi:hypothetical protein